MRNLAIAFAAAVVVTALSGAAAAQTVPQQVSVQGSLRDATQALLDGDVSLTFRIYDDAAGTSMRWSEAQTVTVSRGLFGVAIPADTASNPFPTTLFESPALWLGVQPDGEAPLPLAPLLSAPYCMRAASVASEQDPQVGTLTAQKWCAANASGDAIACDQDAPTLTESDPTVTSSTHGSLPRWDGTSGRLVDSVLTDSGAGVVWVASSSNLAVGSSSNAGYRLRVYGAGYADGNWHAPSDIRLKRDVCDLDSPLDAVLQLRPVRYHWRQDLPSPRRFDERPHIGLIAQETEEVLPEIVRTGDDGYKAMTYSVLAVVVAGAVKELADLVFGGLDEVRDLWASYDTLARENARLREDLIALEDELDALRARLIRVERRLSHRP